MKELYLPPTAEVLYFGSEDILTSSPESLSDDFANDQDW